MGPVIARKPRFQRQPGAIARGFRITERDEAIMLIVARHRVARSSQIIALIRAINPGASAQQIRRRLDCMYHTRYLSRPQAQLESYHAGAGSRPISYMLGNRGADLLAREHGLRRAAVDWTAKARTATHGALEHAIGITDFMVALELACRRRGTLELVYFDEILRTLAPAATRTNPRPYHWPVSAPWQGGEHELYVIPDKIFGIRDLRRPESRRLKFFCYEHDRGSMPVVRSNLAQSSILRKLIGYGQTYRGDLHTAIYGLPNFRVLTEVPGRSRVTNMIVEGYYQQHLADLYPPGLYLFTDRRTLFAAEDFLEHLWLEPAAYHGRWKLPAERLAAEPAFQANDVIGSPHDLFKTAR
jgi:Replication-relaxation